MKTDLFQSCGHCWIQICWHNECSTLTASSFRILNSSAGIPSPLLVLFVAMLPKAHLTSHSGSRWVMTKSWSSGSQDYVLLIAPTFLKSFPFFCFLLFPCIAHLKKNFLISPCYSLELCIQLGISFLFSFASLLFLGICKASSDNHFAFLHFLFFEMVLNTASCTMLWTSIRSSSGTLPTRPNPLNLFIISTV